MKLCILGDTHIGARNDSQIFHDHFEKFYTDTFFPYLEQHDIKHILQLGDLFDRRKYINFQTLKRGKEYFFDRLNQYTTWVLVGNHDTYYKNTNEVNSLELLLEGYKNINIINNPEEISLDGIKMLIIPWICEKNIIEINKAIQSSDATIVAGHFEISGFEMYKGAVHEGGIDPDFFKNYELVISGHFHHKSTHRNISYLGTPYEMTWSDYDDPKGFHIFDTEDRSLTFVPNPDKMFYKLHYNDANQPPDYYKHFEVEQYAGKIVKVIISAKENPICFDKCIERLERAGVADLQVVDDHLNLDLEGDDDIINEAEDTVTILKKYVEQIEVPVDKKQLNILIQDLYQEALSIE